MLAFLRLDLIFQFVRWLLAMFGIGTVYFVGLGTVFSWGADRVTENLGQLPLLTLQLLGLVKADIAINIILSAYATNMTMMAYKQFRLK